MDTADQLVKLMFSWIEQSESCAKQLKKLADELETIKVISNFAECVGNSASVVGAAGLIGAGLLTVFTGGAAAPALVLAGGVYGGVGAAVSVTTKIIEHFSSSATLKEAQKNEEKSNETAEKIQKHFEKLKAEVKKMYPSADPDEVDRHVMSAFMGATARLSGLKLNIDFSRFFHLAEDGIFLSSVLSAGAAVTHGLPLARNIFQLFLLKTGEKEMNLLFAEGTKQLIKTSLIGLKTAIQGGAMVVGGVVALGFALDEAIDNWKDLITNNRKTEASRSIRKTADDIQKMCRTLRKQFDNMRTALKEMDRKQREEEEEARRQREERKNSQQAEQTGGDQGDEERDDEDKERDQGEKKSDSEEETEESEQTGRKKKTKRHQKKVSQRSNKQIHTDDQCEINPTPPGAIRLALLNTQSMNNKIPQILELITQNNLDVLLTTETWLQDNTAETILREASPPNFSSHSQQRVGIRGGGVANQFSKKLQGEQIPFALLNITTFEFVVTVVQHDEWNQPVMIINLYHPPGYNQERFRKFLDEFQSLLDEVSYNSNSFIVTGDFNIQVNNERRTFTDEFEYILPLYNLEQHVKEPTHRRGNTLDLVITRNVEVSGLFVRDDGISDHSTVYFNAKPKDTRKKTKRKKKQEQTKRVRRTED